MEKRNPVTSHYLIFPEVTWKHVIPLLFLLSNVTLESDTSNVNRKRKTATTEFHGQSPRWAHARPEHPIHATTHTETTQNSLASASACTLCRRLDHRRPSLPGHQPHREKSSRSTNGILKAELQALGSWGEISSVMANEGSSQSPCTGGCACGDRGKGGLRRGGNCSRLASCDAPDGLSMGHGGRLDVASATKNTNVDHCLK